MVVDRVTGTFQIGTNAQGEVVLQFNETVVTNGHIIFSPNQALEAAKVFRKQAKIAQKKLEDIHRRKLMGILR